MTFVLLLLALGLPGVEGQITNYKIAVLDNSRNPDKHYKRWAPTFEDAVNAHAEKLGVNFRLYVTVLPFDNLTAAAGANAVDLTLTNTGHSAIIENTYGYRPLVSLENMRLGYPLAIFGGVASTHVDSDIQHISDCFKPGKKVAAVSKKSFGGYLMQKREALRQGIPYISDDDVTFTDSHEASMKAAHDRTHDCAFARTDRLESNQQKGATDIVGNLRVIEERSGTDYTFFPFKCSTQLYPEWVVLGGPNLPNDVFDLMRGMLQSIRTVDDAAVTGQYSRWFPPSSSAEVIQALYETNALQRPGDAKGFPFEAVLPPVFIVLVLAIVGMFVRLATVKKGRDLKFAPKSATEPFAVTFTDIQSSTALWAREPTAMSQAVELHHEIIRKLLHKHRGYEVKTIGDSFMSAFSSGEDALRFAAELQTEMHTAQWPPEIEQAYQEILNALGASSLWNGIRVRVGMNFGDGEVTLDAVTGGYDYYGTLVNTAARVEAAAHGGQVLIPAEALAKIGPLPSGISVKDLGPQPLRGLDAPVVLMQLASDGPLSLRTFPPLRLDREVDWEQELESHHESDTRSKRSVYSLTSSHHHSLVLRSSNFEELGLHAEKCLARQECNAASIERLLDLHAFLKVLFTTTNKQFRGKSLGHLATKWRVRDSRDEGWAANDQQYEIVTLELAAKVMKTLDIQTQRQHVRSPTESRPVDDLRSSSSRVFDEGPLHESTSGVP